MGKKLYVGNLSWGVTDDQLRELFTPYGTVASAQVITDRDTGRSKGFGFVEMGTDQEAQAAIDGMHGQMIDGRALTVNEARPKEGGGGGGGRGGGGGGRGGGGWTAAVAGPPVLIDLAEIAAVRDGGRGEPRSHPSLIYGHCRIATSTQWTLPRLPRTSVPRYFDTLSPMFRSSGSSNFTSHRRPVGCCKLHDLGAVSV